MRRDDCPIEGIRNKLKENDMVMTKSDKARLHIQTPTAISRTNSLVYNGSFQTLKPQNRKKFLVLRMHPTLSRELDL